MSDGQKIVYPDVGLPNQKPDKPTQWARKPHTEGNDPVEPDTTLRDEIFRLLQFDGTMKEADPVIDAILDAVAKRLPEEKGLNINDPSEISFAKQGFDQCLCEVRAIIEASNG